MTTIPDEDCSPVSALGISREEAVQKLRCCHAVVGYDGFLDTITKAVRKAGTDSEGPEYFDSLAGFGSYLASHAQMNCSVELEVVSRKFGGNAPILSNALGGLGAQVDCIGTFGVPQIHKAFSNLKCRLHSFAPASDSLALEFKDGKFFLGQNAVIEGSAWTQLCWYIGKENLIRLMNGADLIALVNWSELPYAQTLWEGTFQECLALQPCDKKRIAFFDLCDIARKTESQVLSILELLQRYTSRRYTVLSMNKNEALRIGVCLNMGNDLSTISTEVLNRYCLDEVVIHTMDHNLCKTRGGETVECKTFPVSAPAVLTGAGDNFNAAYCAGLLLGIPLQNRIRFATAFASSYIQTGQSPTL